MHTELERVYRDNFTGQPIPHRYIHLDGGSYDYYFKPEQDAYQLVSRRIRTAGRTGTIAAGLLRLTTTMPQLGRALPRVRLVRLEQPESTSFDVAIVGKRIKTIHLDEKLVYTFPGSGSRDIRMEAAIRRALPKEMNVPEIVTFDTDYPYFAERYVAGETLRNPVTQSEQLFAALEQLEPLYREEFRDKISTDSHLAALERDLIRNPTMSQTLIENAFRRLESLETPDRLTVSQIHGDLHVENIVLVDGEIYLLDWESSKESPVIIDFFTPFEVLYTMSSDPSILRQMMYNSGVGGDIAARYATTFGEFAYGRSDFPSGLPLIALLHRLSEVIQKADSPQDHTVHRLLTELL